MAGFTALIAGFNRIAGRGGAADAAMPGTAGIVEASKLVQVDGSRNITNFNNIQLDGDLTADGQVYAAGYLLVNRLGGQATVNYQSPNVAKGETYHAMADNAGDTTNAYITDSQLAAREFHTPDPKSAKTSTMFGKILGYLTDIVPFNGDTPDATSETTVLTGTIANGYARPGSQIDLTLTLSLTAVNGADTLTIKIKRNSTVIATTDLDVSDLGVIVSTLSEQIQALGASGKVFFVVQIPAAVNSYGNIDNDTVDTTDVAGIVYSVTAQWSSNNAGNTADFLGGRILEY